MAALLQGIREIDSKEEIGPLSESDLNIHQKVKDKFQCKAREEGIKRRQRSRALWLKEGDMNTKFFHSFASHRNRMNRISILLAGNRRLESKEEISGHVLAFYKDLFTKEDSACPSLDNLESIPINTANADSLEKAFDETEVRAAVFNRLLGQIKL